MRIFGHPKQEKKTDDVRSSTVLEGNEAKKAIESKFDALFKLMDETLISMSKDIPLLPPKNDNKDTEQ